MTIQELIESLVCVKVYPTMVYFVFETCTMRATYGSRNDTLFNWHLTKTTAKEDEVKSDRIPGWESIDGVSGRVTKTSVPFAHSTQLQEPSSVDITLDDQTWTIEVDPGFATSYNEISRSTLNPFKPKQMQLDQLLGLDPDEWLAGEDK